MANVLVAYYSHGGNTRKMAQRIAEALEEAGCRAEAHSVTDISVERLREFDGIVLGSPCYFGVMAAEMKRFIDQSIKLFGKGELTGKAGGVFCSTGGIGGGGELTLLSLLAGLMIHGMVVQGSRKGGHFGPLAIGEPDERALAECGQYGRLVAGLAQRLAG